MTLSVAGGTLSAAGGTLVGLAAAPTGASFVSAASHSGFEASSVVPALAGVQATDVLVAFAAASNGTGRLVTPPAGWTQIATTDAASVGQQVFTAPGSANASTTWTWPTSQWSRVAIAAYRGVATPTTASVVSPSAAATSLDAPSQTTLAANALLVCFGGSSTGSAQTFTPAMNSRATAAGGGGFLLADQTIATPGATGVRTFASGASAILTAASLHLEPS